VSVNHIFQRGADPDTTLLLTLWTEYINQKEEERKRLSGALVSNVYP